MRGNAAFLSMPAFDKNNIDVIMGMTAKLYINRADQISREEFL